MFLRAHKVYTSVRRRPECIRSLSARWFGCAVRQEVWVGEGGGTGCGEGPASHQLLSNTAVDMYWWLDALGNTAAHGHQRFLRET